MSLNYQRCTDEIVHQTGEFADLLRSGADLGATVPTCPEWDLAELAKHTGRALLWSGQMVRSRTAEELPDDEVVGREGPAEDGGEALAEWLEAAAAELAAGLREAGPDAAVWAWAWDRTTAFWARRMTHELAVHRADAALAAGVEYRVDAAVAADAVEEWLQIVDHVERNYPEHGAGDLRGDGSTTLHLHATDAPAELAAEWLITLAPDGFTWVREHGKATVALRGPLTELMLAFHRRRSPDAGELEVFGDRALLDFWLKWAELG